MCWLLRDGGDERMNYAQKVLGVFAQEDGDALVPGIWAVEAANVMVNAQARQWVTEARCAAFADTMQLARRLKLSSYEASYLELAMHEGLPRATLDGDLRRAMQQTGVALA
jgi:hypothetical protein